MSRTYHFCLCRTYNQDIRTITYVMRIQPTYAYIWLACRGQYIWGMSNIWRTHNLFWWRTHKLYMWWTDRQHIYISHGSLRIISDFFIHIEKKIHRLILGRVEVPCFWWFSVRFFVKFKICFFFSQYIYMMNTQPAHVINAKLKYVKTPNPHVWWTPNPHMKCNTDPRIWWTQNSPIG